MLSHGRVLRVVASDPVAPGGLVAPLLRAKKAVSSDDLAAPFLDAEKAVSTPSPVRFGTPTSCRRGRTELKCYSRERHNSAPASSCLRDSVADVAWDMMEVYDRIHAAYLPEPESYSTPGLREGETDICEASTEVSLVQEEILWSQARGRSSDVATVLVVLKAFVGGTLLVLPASMLKAGLVTGNLTFWLVGLMELYGMLKLLDCHRKCGGSFGNLAGRAMGPLGSSAVEASIVLSQLGFAAAEMIYVAKNGAFVVNWLLERSSYSDFARELDIMSILIWLQLTFVIPVGFLNDLGAFTVFNVIGNTFVLGALVILSAVTLQGLVHQGAASDLRLSSSSYQILVFAGFSAFAFEGINMVIPMFSAHRNKENFEWILSCTMIGIMLLFSVFGSANVVLYGDTLQPILTMNMDQTSVLVLVVPSLFAVASLVLVVLMAFPTFEILEERVRQKSTALLSTSGRIKAFRALLIVLCALLAQFGGQCLDKFLALVGAIGCVPLAFIYPAVVHLRLVASTTAEVLSDCTILAFGVGIMLACTYSTLQTI